jgi:photosystem II stability/assembly factor-like uncharacterized protein
VTRRRLSALCLSLAVVIATPALRASAPPLRPDLYRTLSFRFIGPDGNRVSAVLGVPGNPEVMYLGAASGGIWRTRDGGIHWRDVFAHEPVQSIGALALDPRNPNIVWAGTGESFYIRPSTAIGDGVWKSVDGGRRWIHMGLRQSGRIPRIVVDPDDPERVYVCALGSGFSASSEQGVFVSRDGGRHWRRLLYVNGRTGCSDLAIDPRNPRVLLAGTWQWRVRPWELRSGGAGSGLYLSRNGGRSWTRLEGHGLPPGPWGKVAVAIAPSAPRIFYALIQARAGGLYRSDDGGRRWRLVSHNHTMDERPPYFTRFAVSPRNPERLYFASVNLTTSRNGGKTLRLFPSCGCGDTHDIWIDPRDPRRIIVGDDLGAVVTLDGGRLWHRIVLPIAQLYHVATDETVPYHVYTNRQDGYTYRLPSDTRGGAVIGPGSWKPVGGCESGYSVPNPAGTVVWSGCYDGGLTRFVVATGQGRDVRVRPIAHYGWPPRDERERWNFVFPIARSPLLPHVVYVGSQYVWRTKDGGASWTRISPDLTRNDRAREGPSGGVTRDELGTFTADALSVIVPSPLRRGTIWVGSYDGLVHLTTDGGRTWRNVTPPSVPSWGAVTAIALSFRDPRRAYVAIDRQLMGDSRPYILRTDDDGRHWRRITRGIPSGVFSYVESLATDPDAPGVLFAGTGNALYWSPDRGRRWLPLQNNLPHAPVTGVVVQPVFDDLVVGTYGRGAWILDDVGPLTRLDRRLRAQAFHFFRPHPAWRFRRVAVPIAVPDYPADGRNPPYGAILDYYLRPGSRVRRVVLRIRDARGRLVRVLSSAPGTRRADRLPAPHAGLNRLVWDLRYAPVKRARLRTAPPGDRWLWRELGRCRILDDACLPPAQTIPPPGRTRERPIVTWDLDLTQRGPLVPPGTYTLSLSVGRWKARQPIRVLKDPHSLGTLADIRAQVRLALEIRADLDRDVRAINRLEWLRWTLHRLEARASRGRNSAILAAARSYDRRARKVEGALFDIHLTGAREDAFRHRMRLYGQFCALLKDVESESADYAPTSQDVAAYRILAGRLGRALARVRAVLRTPPAVLTPILAPLALLSTSPRRGSTTPLHPTAKGGARDR